MVQHIFTSQSLPDSVFLHVTRFTSFKRAFNLCKEKVVQAFKMSTLLTL